MRKYFVPSIPSNLFRKQDLIAQMDAAFARDTNFVFIKAPAGYGKTYLMLDYAYHLSSKNSAAIWLKFDAEYRSFEDYFANFIEVLKVSNLLSQGFYYDENISSFQLINQILNELQEINDEVYMFFDDFKSINNPKFIDALELFLLHDISSIKMIMTSRIELPFSLTNAFIRDQVLKISYLDLAFTAQEIQRYSEMNHRQSYSSEQAQLIFDKTGGWPAILALNSEAFKFDEELSEINFDQGNVELSQMLYQESIAKLDEKEAKYLTCLSISHYFSLPLAAKLTGFERISLSDIENIPLLKVNNPLLPHHFDWYMLQPLIREYIHAKIKTTDPELHKTLHFKAGEWFYQQEVFIEAVEHFLKAGAFERVVEILETYGIVIIARGNFPRFRKVIQKLPYKYLVSNMAVLMLQGWYYSLNYQHSSAVAIEASMNKIVHENPNLKDDFEYDILGLQSAIAYFSDQPAGFEQKIEQALENKPLALEYLENSLRAILAFIYVQNDKFDALEQLKSEAQHFARGRHLFFSSVYFNCCIALLEFAKGNLNDCQKVCDQTLRFMESKKHDSNLHHLINILEGMCVYMKGDLVTAKELFDESGKVANNLAEPMLLSWYYPIHIQLLEDLDLKVQQEEFIDALLKLTSSRNISLSKCPLIHKAVEFHLSLNHPDDALSIYQNFKEELAEVKSYTNNHLYTNVDMLDCLMHTSQGQFEAHEEKLTELASQYEKSGRVIQAINCLIALVNVAIETKHNNVAKRYLKKIVTLAASKNLIQILSKLSPLAIEYLSEWVVSEWSEKRKSFMAEVCERFGGDSSALPYPAFQIEELTATEKKVMDLLALGHANKVIAEKLGVSINTVKFHLKIIFSKLGVSNRIQANLVYAQNKDNFS